jgi:peroxiredoxin
VRASSERRAASFDVVLPQVPVGMAHLRDGGQVLLVHYWAPWERNGAAQAALLDSLRREPDLEGLRAVIVCFDPFPSVSRFVARRRLRLPVLLDTGRRMRSALPCPSVPYTYVLDRDGRIAVEQPGEVDWFAPGSRATLRALIDEAERPRDPAAAPL